ncbi:hypothetical protein PEC301653_03410 [Pectobacterium carotovorum subsp. carotovorum]|nr:hypothetical protein PEC301653_03410 [Pectobacterium carotovorum subsp. carotovorum]
MKNNLTNKKTIISIVSALVILAVPIILYVLNMSGEFSQKNDDWGYFGSYIGGVYSVILSFLSLIAILYFNYESRKINKEQMSILSSEQFTREFTLLLRELNSAIDKKTIADTNGNEIKIEEWFDRKKRSIIKNTKHYNIVNYDDNNQIDEICKSETKSFLMNYHTTELKQEAILCFAILKIIHTAPPSFADAYKIIFENRIDNTWRFLLEAQLKHQIEESVSIFKNWPDFSQTPNDLLRVAKANLAPY